MKKLTNHTHEFGSTGSVMVSEGRGVLLCAGYDLDTGHSMINSKEEGLWTDKSSPNSSFCACYISYFFLSS